MDSTSPTDITEIAIARPDESATITVDFGGASHCGYKRSNNEDHFLVARLDRTMHMLASNLSAHDVPASSTVSAYGLLVADGMGGHAAGEVASRTAIATFVDLVLRTPDLIMRLEGNLSEEVLRRLDARFQKIKVALHEKVRLDPELAGMGTTMTLACTFGMELVLAHVGDSRAYLFRDGSLKRLTRDQTMAQFLADSGCIKAEEIAQHPLRNVLTNVLGTQGGPLDVDLRGLRLQAGDQVLLCTDGLTDMVDEPAIEEVLRAPGQPAAQACERLVALALAAGGNDNVTVVIGRYLAN
jgi:PPM family protein phosphatase